MMGIAKKVLTFGICAVVQSAYADSLGKLGHPVKEDRLPRPGAAEESPLAEEPHKAPPSQFTTTVQIAVMERSPELTQRGQNLVVEQFHDVFQSWPEFQGRPYRVTTSGREVIFYVTTPKDMRQPMQRAMAYMIQHLNGRVRARGRSQFYRTSLEQSRGGLLEVVTDDSHSKILSVSAQSVPLRDILKEIKLQVGGLSYLIPGTCAKQLVDWSFGNDEGGEASEPKTVEAAMRELGALFSLQMERQNSTYIFSGTCQQQVRRHAFQHPPELLQTHLWADLPDAPSPPSHPRAQATEVFFPLVPLTQ